MAGLTLNVLLQDIQKLETEALVVGFFEDVRPLKGLAGSIDWVLCGALSALILQHGLRGSIGEIGLLTSRGKVPAQKIFMAGYGSRKDATVQSLRKAAAAATASVVSAGVKEAAFEYASFPGLPIESGAPAFYEGIADGAGKTDVRIAVLAPDAVMYEKMQKLLRDFSTGSSRLYP